MKNNYTNRNDQYSNAISGSLIKIKKQPNNNVKLKISVNDYFK